MRKLTVPGVICLLLLLPLFCFRPEPTFAQAAVTSTPNSDGSIIHIVQAGESLISIADAYQVSIDDIKALNNLDSDEIFAGDTLIIRAAATTTPTGTSTGTATGTPEPTTTRSPTHTPTTTPRPASAGLNVTPDASQLGERNNPADRLGNILLGAIITLGVLGVGMMVIGGLMRRKSSGDVS